MGSLSVLSKVKFQNTKIIVSQVIGIICVNRFSEIILCLLSIPLILFVTFLRCHQRIVGKSDGIKNISLRICYLFQVFNRFGILSHFLVAQPNVIQTKSKVEVPFYLNGLLEVGNSLSKF